MTTLIGFGFDQSRSEPTPAKPASAVTRRSVTS